MALVTKNDVTQIFAIQAPEIDLPPTFANYPRGWDTARTNNGKPTIKQFNYIQQRTDQNMLWIHQNGAALPYDATMEYAEGAVVIKDGELQQWKGGVWVKVATWDSIESKPTTVDGYGIIDAYTKTEAGNLFIESAEKGVASGIPTLDTNAKVPVSQMYAASTTQAGIVQLVDDLTTGGTDKALTAEQGKSLLAQFITSRGESGRINIPNPNDLSKPTIIQWVIKRVIVPANSVAYAFTGNWFVAFPNSCNLFVGVKRNQLGLMATIETADQTSFTGYSQGANIDSEVVISVIGIGS